MIADASDRKTGGLVATVISFKHDAPQLLVLVWYRCGLLR